MQLGIGSYTYGWAVGSPETGSAPAMSALDLLGKAKAFGLKLVQYGDNLPLHELPDQELQTLKQRADECGIALEVGARRLTKEHLSRYILLAEQLDSRLLRFVIDGQGYEPSLPEITLILKGVAKTLEGAGITLGIENHDRLKAREFGQLMDQVGSNAVGICLDSVNSMGAGEGLEEVVKALAPYTVNLHVKDFGIKRLPHLMGFQIDGRPAGKGMLSVPWLLQQLAPYRRCHTAILEQWVVPEPDIQATRQKEEAWAEESIRYLKPFFEE